jgi:NAD(P)-dependent dehydrogenase (short-subunit alcohol dehydrogenase family)
MSVPDQSGRLAIVTGANTGLGLETALALAAAGGEVIMGVRDLAKGEAAARRIRTAHSGARVRVEALDLSDLASVRAFAKRMQSELPALDGLINNAGLMGLGSRTLTRDGFEMQLGVNYLGHFALTAELLPLLRRRPGARVVSLSSAAHHMGRIRLEDLNFEQGYKPLDAYAQSKLAMLVFAFELQRRSDQNGWDLLSVAAHPGYARTDLIRPQSGLGQVLAGVSSALAPLVSQSAAEGAKPILYAATSPQARGGGYYGPDGVLEFRGAVKDARIAKSAQDLSLAQQLWARSESLTGTAFPQA